MKTTSFKDLLVWQKSMELVKEIYLLTAQLPPEERFGLYSQMRRAVVSIPSNIAEGYMRKHRKEYFHFISISLASSGELETQLLVIQMIYPNINIDKAYSLQIEVSKMLYSMYERMEGGSK